MAVPAIMAGISAVTSLASAGMKASGAKKQAEQAKQLRNQAKRPKRDLKSAKEELALARSMAFGEAPGTQTSKDMIMSSTRAAIEQALKKGQGGSEILQTIGLLAAKEQEGMLNLGERNKAYQIKRRDEVRGSLDKMAGVEKQQHQDELDKYYETTAAASALEYAANKNKETAVNEAMGTLSSTAMSLGTMDNIGNKTVGGSGSLTGGNVSGNVGGSGSSKMPESVVYSPPSVDPAIDQQALQRMKERYPEATEEQLMKIWKQSKMFSQVGKTTRSPVFIN